MPEAPSQQAGQTPACESHDNSLLEDWLKLTY